jgi:Nif-specific regulatory protein
LHPGSETLGLCQEGGCASYYHQKKKENPDLAVEEYVRNYPSRRSGKVVSISREEEIARVASIEAPVSELMPGFVVYSDAMMLLHEKLKRVSPRDTAVLISGESGVGKEYIAEAIHMNSARAHGSYVIVDCATLSETLFEAELFGHVKGSYTGASSTEKGLLQKSEGGTVFLDEISTLSPKLQMKLLRFLEKGTLRKLGSIKDESVDTRVVAATNAPLRELVEDGNFRKDLFYRLNVFSLFVEPLRERTEDIPVLALYIARGISGTEISFSERVIDFFEKYPWPGNVRELRNTVEYALVMCRDDIITTHDLPDEFVRSK